MWRAEEIAFDLLGDVTAHPVATVEVRTLAGVVVVMAEPEARGRVLVLRGLHMHGRDDDVRRTRSGPRTFARSPRPRWSDGPRWTRP